MKNSLKVISAAACAAILAGSFSVCVYAKEPIGRVKIRVSNEVIMKDEGEVSMVNEWVPIYEDSTATGLLMDLLAENDISQTGAEQGYITEIGGFTAGGSGATSCWMFLLNDWVTDEAITAYTVASGKLRDGDELCFEYSLDYGADLGYDWSGTDTSLSELGNAYKLSPEFSPEVKEYTLELSSEETSVSLKPKALNKAFRVKMYKNEYTPSDSSKSYAPGAEIDVTDGDVIYIGVGDPAWHSYMPDGTEKSVYTVTVNGGLTPYDPSSEQGEGEIKYINQDIPVSQILDDVSETVMAKAGDVWDYMTLARLGKLNDEDKKEFLDHIRKFIADDDGDVFVPTEYEKNIITLAATGEDPTDFEGTDLTAPLSDHAFIKDQGLNASIYALIAFDTKKYDIPAAKSGAEQTTREALINDILSAELEGGGWTFWGKDPDVDMTAMALTALAPYVSDSSVKEAVDRGLDFLSKAQKDNAFFNYGTHPSTESCAQVIVALCSLGIDPTKDERFIKNGKSVIDAIKVLYSPEDKAFFSIGMNIDNDLEKSVNTYSTTQAYYALCAYQRLTEGKTALFDMTDVTAGDDQGENDPEKEDGTGDNKDDNKDEDPTQETPANTEGGNSQQPAQGVSVPATGDMTATVTVVSAAALISAAVMIFLKKRRTEDK